MARELVLVHGRAQQELDPDDLKAEWVDALKRGLEASDLELPIDEASIRYPFYGNTLVDLIDTDAADDFRDVIVRSAGDGDDDQAQFLEEVALECRGRLEDVTDAEIVAAGLEADSEVIARGVQNSALVVGILKLIDERLPGFGGTAIALATSDVYHYLMTPGIQEEIAEGVAGALSSDAESVVVAHSLGSVVAYKLLRENPDRFRVPTFITVGSPLGVTAIRRALAPIAFPAGVRRWRNAYDPHDIVALHPLEKPWFGVTPEVSNMGNVDNRTANRHGISGYLSDPVVARWIYDALTDD